MGPTGTRASWRLLAAMVVSIAAVALCVGSPSDRASASTATTLLFEGGTFAEPIMNRLLVDDESSMGTITPSYFDANVDVGRQDFASGAGDVAVTEFPLTSAEASTAASNGRSFAYVPFAASADALSYVLICSSGAQDPFCPDLQVTALQAEEMFSSDITQWNGPTLSTITGGTGPVDPENSHTIGPGDIIDPSASNYALLSYFAADPSASAAWTQFVVDTLHQSSAAPTEAWPGDQGISGGDLELIENMVPVNSTTGLALPNNTIWGQNVNVAPLPVDWLPSSAGGNTTGVELPALAVQNAAGSFVAPTLAGESAALNDATIDPTTNLVTFPANGGSDPAAYPIMVMSYLVVPTSGLSAAKAAALSQFLQFVFSSAGVSDITGLGAAPPTPAMTKIGDAVAAEVAAEASAPVTSTTTTTTVAARSTGGGSLPGGGSSPSFPSASANEESSEIGEVGTGSGGANAAVTLAYTGVDIVPILGLGVVLAVAGFVGRRRLRRSLPPP